MNRVYFSTKYLNAVFSYFWCRHSLKLDKKTKIDNLIQFILVSTKKKQKKKKERTFCNHVLCILIQKKVYQHQRDVLYYRELRTFTLEFHFKHIRLFEWDQRIQNIFFILFFCLSEFFLLQYFFVCLIFIIAILCALKKVEILCRVKY